MSSSFIDGACHLPIIINTKINGLKINAGEFIYLYKNDEELMLHVINNSGIIDSDIIYLVGDEVLIIPKGSKILEDYYSLFIKITPEKNIFFTGFPLPKENLGKISIIAECIERRELHLFLEDMEDVISQLLEANGSIVNEKGILVPIYDKKGEK